MNNFKIFQNGAEFPVKKWSVVFLRIDLISPLTYCLRPHRSHVFVPITSKGEILSVKKKEDTNIFVILTGHKWVVPVDDTTPLTFSTNFAWDSLIIDLNNAEIESNKSPSSTSKFVHFTTARIFYHLLCSLIVCFMQITVLYIRSKITQVQTRLFISL